MRVKKMNRYFCDHCKKSMGTKVGMEKHELGCTMNPNRVCGMCGYVDANGAKLSDLIELVRNMWTKHEASRESNTDWIDSIEMPIDELRIAAHGCPACMLAALRQSGNGCIAEFSFQDEKARFWDEVKENFQG